MAKHKNLEIERLRGCAVILTMFAHVHQGWLTPVFQLAWAGVDLFFVISGFVITNSLLALLPKWNSDVPLSNRFTESLTPLRVFYVKRFYRIMPLAFVSAVIALLVQIFARGHAVLPDAISESLALASGFYNYTFAAKQNPGTIYLAYWSLAVEEHFYAIFPFFLILLVSFERRLLGVAAVIGLVALVIRPISVTGVSIEDWGAWRFPTHLRADALSAGVLIALLRSRSVGESFADTSRWFWLPIHGMLALIWLLPYLATVPGAQVSSSLLVSLWLCAGVLIWFASFESGIILNVPIVRPFLEYVGSRSFALYLSHTWPSDCVNAVRPLLLARFPEHEFLIRSSMNIVTKYMAMFLIAEVLYRFVEQPFIGYGSRRAQEISAKTSINRI
jgi:peptidoglycan/LPS O-acetylase OafA/YrhL